jgi:Right handed beta helix region/RTX calcium-binding nonapeptide repeat (4 copies)
LKLAYTPLRISTAAATVVPFENAKPIVTKWVSPTGSNSGSGSSSSPYKTLQYAVDKAAPGTAIMVKAGTYTENIKISKSGTTDKPIWLVSANGEGSATIKAANTSLPVVYGYGVDNLVVKGFKLSGGTEGIKFTQSGNNLKNMATNIVIEENTIYGQKIDGIKTAQTIGAAITGNTVHNISSQEGIDNVYMRNGIIANNEVYDVRGLSGIVVKAGSQNVKIINNNVYKTPDGILVGGHSDKPGYIFPKGLNYQAKGITVQDNKVSATKQAVFAMGGVDSVIKENSLTSSNWNVAVTRDNLGYASKNIQIVNNDVSKGNWLWASSGSVSVNKSNSTSTWFDSSQLGPDKLKMYGASGAVAGASGAAPSVLNAVKMDMTEHNWKDSGSSTKSVSGTAAADTLTGTAGNDTIDGKGGSDKMTGLAGDDRYVVDSKYDVVVESAGGGRDTIELYDTSYTLSANVENLVVHTETGAVVRDNALDNIITAGPGADTFVNTGGHDLIRNFKLGQDHIDLDLSEVTVARTTDDDMVLQHDGASVILVGVYHNASLSEILI